MADRAGTGTPAERLDWVRRQLGLQQKEIAARLGVTQSAYSSWVCGYNPLTLRGALAAYEAFGVSPDFLLLGLTGNLPDEWRQRWEVRP